MKESHERNLMKEKEKRMRFLTGLQYSKSLFSRLIFQYFLYVKFLNRTALKIKCILFDLLPQLFNLATILPGM